MKFQNINIVWKFGFIYVLITSFLFTLIYFEGISPFYLINELQTDLSVYLTELWINFYDIPIYLSGETVSYTHGLELKILNVCNGLAVYLFFLAAILAYPSSNKEKFYWAVLSYVVILIANTIRIDWILYHVIAYPEEFTFVHEVLGRYALATIPLIMFYLFTDKKVVFTN